jgi:hypothetical protein
MIHITLHPPTANQRSLFQRSQGGLRNEIYNTNANPHPCADPENSKKTMTKKQTRKMDYEATVAWVIKAISC